MLAIIQGSHTSGPIRTISRLFQDNLREFSGIKNLDRSCYVIYRHNEKMLSRQFAFQDFSRLTKIQDFLGSWQIGNRTQSVAGLSRQAGPYAIPGTGPNSNFSLHGYDRGV